ncbi:ADP-dependent glucokinase [Lingula anatina]|uniref:ADP-dependent glucokinase n=1 Tax=Lingula anatina TaxID=7574 RepID=A0A1S3J7V3_LINAN|nr:ADP-dependent glucokinase [Lingula anatina]|eukprot:XP_013406311.1 ADP-dependent glucokinase [Lingula anatina]
MSLLTKAGGVVSLSIFVALVAYLHRSYNDKILNDRLDSVLRGLLRAEKKVSFETRTRVAVGFGACVDGFVNATDIFHNLGFIPPDIPEHYSVIRDQDELGKVFSYFFRHGAAGERYIENRTLFESIVNEARRHSFTRWAVGGNAPVMAQRFAKEGCEVMLGAKVSPHLAGLLGSNIKIAGDTIDDEDIHIALEYATGTSWGNFKSPRANRFFIHSDQFNPYIDSLELFSQAAASFSPQLLVVGGLQMMDSFPFKPGVRKERLQKLGEVLASTSKNTMIHFEMASFSEEALLQDLVEHVIPYSDSLGMNEQELPNLYSALMNGTATLISDAYPRIAHVLDQMRAVYKILSQTSEKNNRRKLTRLHVHTLAYQAIITTSGSPWKNTMSAAAKASLTANRHVCGSNFIHLEKARLIIDESFAASQAHGSRRISFENNRPVSCWKEGNYEFCVAPVLVCTQVFQTAGGGDNVSSAGLAVQI